MDNPIFGVPRSLRFAAGPAHFADGDDGDGGDNDSSGDQGSSGDGSSSSQDVADHLDPNRLIQEHGDAQRALGSLSQKAETLESENADLREERRQLRDQVPSDEDIVLSQERINELQEDGFLDTDTPTEEEVVRALREEREQRVKLENRQKFNRVVELTGADRGVLEDLGEDTANYQLKEVETDDGTEVQVQVETEDGTQPFEEYIQSTYPNLADTILSEEGESQSSSSSDDSGTYVPDQGGGGNSTGDSGATTDVEEFIEQENERRGRA